MNAVLSERRVNHCIGGKLSVVLALLGVLAAAFFLVAHRYIPRRAPVGSALSVSVYALGLLIAPVLFLLGALSGMVGLFSPARKRVLAVVGTLFCGTAFILTSTVTVLLLVSGQ